jgi:hypothetical protein
MPQATREIVLLPLTSLTASSTSSDFVIPDQFDGLIFKQTVGTVTGTSPTLNMYVQEKLGTPAAADTFMGAPTGTATYSDFVSFKQVTATGTAVIRWYVSPVVGSANALTLTTASYAPTDATQTADTVRLGPIGRIWRVKWVIAGTSPVFPTSLVVQLIPR